jgi:hypothetical protein
MTAQFSEHLHYQGQELLLCTESLGPSLRFSGSTLKFEAMATFWHLHND